MTTPNNPTPPPGMEILTDYTKPTPLGTKFFDAEMGNWYPRVMNEWLPRRDITYAIPTHPATGDAKEHHEYCDTLDPIIKGKPCNCKGRLMGDTKPVEQRQELPRYFVIAHDAEGNYETMECNNPVEGWFRLMWDNPTDVPADEVDAFKEFARNTDNWSLHSGQPTHLKWELEDGAIEFYLITHK